MHANAQFPVARRLYGTLTDPLEAPPLSVLFCSAAQSCLVQTHAASLSVAASASAQQHVRHDSSSNSKLWLCLHACTQQHNSRPLDHAAHHPAVCRPRKHRGPSRAAHTAAVVHTDRAGVLQSQVNMGAPCNCCCGACAALFSPPAFHFWAFMGLEHMLAGPENTIVLRLKCMCAGPETPVCAASAGWSSQRTLSQPCQHS